jgi:nucleotide-binding universal stress UspA family protein
MYSTILVGSDGSEPAARAVKAAGEIARRYGVDTVHVVAGYHPITVGEMADLAHEVPSEFVDALSADVPGVQVVDGAKRILKAMQLNVVGHPVPASGADAILDVADQLGADLIVVGSRGHGVGRRMLRGSVSTKVSHHAGCDVLIVHIPHDDD